jgi:hypothetical protein
MMIRNFKEMAELCQRAAVGKYTPRQIFIELLAVEAGSTANGRNGPMIGACVPQIQCECFVNSHLNRPGSPLSNAMLPDYDSNFSPPRLVIEMSSFHGGCIFCILVRDNKHGANVEITTKMHGDFAGLQWGLRTVLCRNFIYL